MNKISLIFLFLSIIAGTASPCFSDNSRNKKESFNSDLKYAQVLFVKAQKNNNTWTFHVTVEHKDEGWDHYADAWQIVNPINGEVIATRTLYHPHENEQPFTRSLSNISIPGSIISVSVQAKCNKHGFGGKEVIVDLTGSKGDSFMVIK